MKADEGVDVKIYVFLTSALAGSEWSASSSGRVTPGTPWIGSWVGPRTGLDDMEKRKFLPLPRLEIRLLGRPACSQPLYRLLYLDSRNAVVYYPKLLTPCYAVALSTKRVATSVGMSRDSSVGIVTGYGLDDRGGGSLSPGRVNNFHFSISSRPALGSIQPPIKWVPGALSRG
jgi:hypothetical protein